MRRLLLLLLLLSWECKAQKITLTNFKEPEDIPKSIPEQLELKQIIISQKSNAYFDTTNFEIRIWKNDSYIPKIKLWQFVKKEGRYSYSNYNYKISAIYRLNDTVILDSYDSLLPTRLPILGGNGVIGFKISELNISQKNNKAKEILSSISIEKLLLQRSFDYSDCSKLTETNNHSIDEKIISALSPKSYSIEIFSNEFYKIVNFPSDLNAYKNCKKNNDILEYANKLIEILKDI